MFCWAGEDRGCGKEERWASWPLASHSFALLLFFQIKTTLQCQNLLYLVCYGFGHLYCVLYIYIYSIQYGQWQCWYQAYFLERCNLMLIFPHYFCYSLCEMRMHGVHYFKDMYALFTKNMSNFSLALLRWDDRFPDTQQLMFDHFSQLYFSH